MKTVQFRRSSPSVPALALALLITMLAVIAACGGSGKSDDRNAEAVSAPQAETEIRMEGLNCFYIVEGSYDNAQEARIAAAVCAKNGGAGLIHENGGRYSVVREAAISSVGDDALELSESGLTMKAQGSADELAALTDAADFLHAQTTETAGLAALLENGTADESSLLALLSIYRTQARSLLRTLDGMAESRAAMIAGAVEGCLQRLEDVMAAPDAGKFRLIHAAACADWISLLRDMKSSVQLL